MCLYVCQWLIVGVAKNWLSLLAGKVISCLVSVAYYKALIVLLYKAISVKGSLSFLVRKTPAAIEVE